MTTALEELLAGWITRQRWFAGKGRAIDDVRIETATDIPVPPHDGRDDRGHAEAPHQAVEDSSVTTAHLRHLIITVSQGDATDRYQLLVGVRRVLPQRLEHMRIGDTPGGVVYDAAHDQDVTGALLEAMARGADIGPLRFRHMPGVEIDTSLRSLVLGAEQSNTSLVYGDAYICKMFRRITPGLNPELEIVSALAARGAPHIAAPYGWIEGKVAGTDTTLAFLQEFLPTANDGWSLALASVRDFYASLPGVGADDAGGDFAAESHRLGEATARIHAELAAAFPGSTIDPPELKRMAERLGRRLDKACAEFPQLRPHAAKIHEAYGRLADVEHPVPVQRVHGDYHLGQVLRTSTEWVVLDFEGEPGQPLAERRALDSPLRDVAGMLRSFEYAARHILMDRDDAERLTDRAAEWSARNRAAFLAGYSAGGGQVRGDDAVLLRALELSKAVYEVGYEARHRPSWISIPLAAFD